MSTYSVRRGSAAHILKYRQRQKTLAVNLLKHVLSKKDADQGCVMLLCEFLVILEQYANTIKKTLDNSSAAKISLSQSQLAMFKIFNSTVKSLEERSVKDYNLSLQIH
tara:strand:+ start:9621 stop:9944 length:324 start_codon:yes stop_codon:yes gene_type:complete